VSQQQKMTTKHTENPKAYPGYIHTGNSDSAILKPWGRKRSFWRLSRGIHPFVSHRLSNPPGRLRCKRMPRWGLVRRISGARHQPITAPDTRWHVSCFEGASNLIGSVVSGRLGCQAAPVRPAWRRQPASPRPRENDGMIRQAPVRRSLEARW